MTHQILRMLQDSTDGSPRFAIFSTGTCRWIKYDLTEAEVIEFFVEQARESARKFVKLAVAWRNRQLYGPSALTFEEANAASVESGGADLIHCGLEDTGGLRCLSPRGHDPVKVPHTYRIGSI